MRLSTVSVHNHGATYVYLNDAHQVPVAYLFENSSAAGCTNAWKQERPSLTVANLHEMCVNGGKSMLITVGSMVVVLHCSSTCASKCGWTHQLSQST